MKLLNALTALGYRITLEGDHIRATYTLPGDPPTDKVLPLLDELRKHKEEAKTHLRFKEDSYKVASHLRQRSYDRYSKKKLAKLAEVMDQAWERLDYPKFKEAVSTMMAIPGLLKSEGGKPQVVRVYSHILGEEIWIASSPEALAYVPEGQVCYLAEEAQALRGASEEDIRQVHMVKKGLGGRLVSVKDIKGEG